MPLRSRFTSFWRTLRGARLDAELDAELRSYLEELVERNIASGMTSEAARRAALLEIGGIDQVKERVRDVRIGRFVDDALRDVAYAWRQLRRTPGFTLAAIATLAIGVGANAAIFSVVNALLIAPLPYADASRLVFVWADQSAEGYPRAPLSGPELVDLDTRSTRFDGFGAIWSTTAALTGEDHPEQLRIGLVTPDFFSVLGANASIGRTFIESDLVTGPPTTILLSAHVFERRYGADASLVGKRIQVNGQPATVIGVMPASFRLLLPPDSSVPDDLDAWLLFDRRRIPEAPRGQRFLRVIGRMRPGVTLADARADVTRIGEEISKAYTDYGVAGRKFETLALQDDSVRDIRGPLLAVFGGVAILLLIACVNVASLLIARAAARSKEIAMRAALGASNSRLIRQHLVEGLLLTALGAATGLIAGRWGLAGLIALAPPSLERLQAATLDSTVVGFSMGVMVMWGVALSLAPLSEVLRVRLATAIRSDAARSTSGQRFRSMLISGQVALSVVLVIGALLLVHSFINLQRADLGFNANNIESFRMAVRAPSREAALAFSRRLESALAHLPGAIGAASLSHAPFDHVPNWGGPYRWEAGSDLSTAPQADYRSLSPGAISQLGIRLIEGRDFTEDDDGRAGPVAIVDRRLANRAWPGQSAVGRRVAVDPFVTGRPVIWTTVVGVVDHVRHRSPVEDVREQVYFPQRQVLRNPAVYIVRAAPGSPSLMPAVREAIKQIDPALPIYDVRPFTAYVNDARATREFTMQLAVIFAIVALVLASVGIYGVIAYSVALRLREFGVRQALGARASEVLRLVARDGAWVVGRGVAAGALIAVATTWLMQGLLFGVSPWDPTTFLSAVPLLIATGVAACVIPARRAVAANPVDALRSE